MIYTFNTFRLWPRWLHIGRVTGNVIKKTTKESRELSHSSRAPPPHRRPARTNCGHHCSAREGLKFQTELPRWHRTSDTSTIQKITIWPKFEASSKPYLNIILFGDYFESCECRLQGQAGRRGEAGRSHATSLRGQWRPAQLLLAATLNTSPSPAPAPSPADPLVVIKL